MRTSLWMVIGSLFGTFALVLFILFRPPADWARIFVRLGDGHAAMSEFEEAFSDYEKALRIQPNYLPAFLQAARLHLDRQECRPALEIFSVLDLEGLSASAHDYYRRGRCYMTLDDPVSAIERGYNLAISQVSQEGLYYYERALAYQRILGSESKARRDFNAARDLGFPL